MSDERQVTISKRRFVWFWRAKYDGAIYMKTADTTVIFKASAPTIAEVKQLLNELITEYKGSN